MSGGVPELGSKISLISKADIRYEGRLFTVDPQECTIALASVRSFGTEDRETQYPVPAQNQVYDYILFRGSDIKDIRVVNNVTQPLNDPAIMQLSMPPSMAGPQQFQTHPILGHPPMAPQFGAGYGAPPMASMGGLVAGIGGIAPTTNRDPRAAGTSIANKPSELLIPGPDCQSGLLLPPPGVESQPLQHRPNEHTHDMLGGASRSTTPASLGSRKSPTAEQGVQAGGGSGTSVNVGGQKRDDKKMTIKPIQPPHQQQRNNQQGRQSQERRNSRGDGQDYHQRNQMRLPNRNQGMNNQNQQQQRNNGGWNRGPQRQRGRPRGGPGGNTNLGPNNTGFKPNQSNQNNQKKTLKFDNDYDFEQANTEFEELRTQLSKVKIDEGVKAEVNGDIDKKDDSGNETGAGENEQEEEHEVFYDKTKSFFDKISCEAMERAKGKSQRTDWRTERKLNSETFGVAATRRGNYRGRGGFRGMGYRGGYRGGFRSTQRRQPAVEPKKLNEGQQVQNVVPTTTAK